MALCVRMGGWLLAASEQRDNSFIVGAVVAIGGGGQGHDLTMCGSVDDPPTLPTVRALGHASDDPYEQFSSLGLKH